MTTQETLIPLGAGFWVLIEESELSGLLIGFKDYYGATTEDSKILWDASIIEIKTNFYIYQGLCFRIQVIRELEKIKIIEFKLEII